MGSPVKRGLNKNMDKASGPLRVPSRALGANLKVSLSKPKLCCRRVAKPHLETRVGPQCNSFNFYLAHAPVLVTMRTRDLFSHNLMGKRLNAP